MTCSLERSVDFAEERASAPEKFSEGASAEPDSLFSAAFSLLSAALEVAVFAEGDAFCEALGEDVELEVGADDDAAEEEDSAGADSVGLSEQPLKRSVATKDADSTAGATSFFCVRY